jgi:hypothetical protein
VGTILANDDITLQAGATVTGRLLAGAQANGAGALVLNNNTIAVPVCSVAPPPPPATGSITVVKNAVGGNGAFAFTSNFGLTSLTTGGGTASQTFSGLTPGSGYSLSETVPAGWTQTSAACTSGTPAAITVTAAATTTCIITNTKAAAAPIGLITVVKNAVGGNGTFAFIKGATSSWTA